MSLESLNDLIWWAFGSGIFSLGIFGNIFGGGGGSTPSYPIAQIQEAWTGAIKRTRKEGAQLISDVNSASRELERKITEQAETLKRDLSAQETSLLDRISEVNRQLAAGTGQLSAGLQSQINQALGILEQGSGLLNETDRAEFQSSIKSLGQDVSEATAEFGEGTTRELEAFRDTTTSLGDTFNQAARGTIDEYRGVMDEAVDLSPERLAKFTQAADFLSQAAIDTRARMLATADPRALELSAIADENAAAMMSGRISSDVQANLARSSAMRALQGGFGASSEMGRGLAARDLGLTSLDLQQRGMQDYERQRTLNFNTRVAGLQADAGQMLANDQAMLQRRGDTLLDAGLRTSESDRNFRGDAATRILGGALAREDTLRQDRIGQAARVFDANINNLGQRTARQAGLLATQFGARAGTATDIFNAGLADLRARAANEANTAGTVYTTGVNAASATRAALGSAAAATASADINARQGVFNTLSQMRSARAGTMVQAYENQYAEQLKRARESNAATGSLIGGAGSLIGGTVGLIATGGNPMGAMIGSQLGGMAGSAAAGSLGYGGYTGGAQGANMGSSMMGFLSGGFGSGGNSGGFGSLFGGGSGINYRASMPYANNVSNISARPVPVPAGM